MIGSLRGTVGYLADDYLTVDVHGVGFQVFVPLAAFDNLPLVGDNIFLFTHLLVREDAMLLFGFPAKEQLDIFLMLLAVNGIGAKTAVAILNLLPPQGVVQAVVLGDEAAFLHIPGIGKKTAARLVLELRDKCSKLLPNMQVGRVSNAPPILLNDQGTVACGALQQLGYSAQDAKNLVAKATDLVGDAGTLEQLITAALRQANV